MGYVKLGSVKAFPDAIADKAQALKPLEEAAEVFGAWQRYDQGESDALGDLLDECADCIQSIANLVDGLGVKDMTRWLEDCEERNVSRGRY